MPSAAKLAFLLSLCLAGSIAAQMPPLTLYGVTATGDVYEVDTTSGVPAYVGNAGLTTETLTASFDRRRLLTSRQSSTAFELHEIDLLTGAATLVQQLPRPLDRAVSMAFTSPTRLVVGGSGPVNCSSCNTQLVAIDVSTGAVGSPTRASGGDAAGMSYDAHRREIDLIDAAGVQLRVHNAQTLGPAGNGFLVGNGASTSHTIEYEGLFRSYVTGDRLYVLDPGSLTATPIGPLFPPGLEFTGIALVCRTAAAAIPRFGTPPNPNALRPFRTSLPQLGQTWDPYIDHTAFMPAATVDGFLVGFGAVDLPTPFGTLLCDPVGSIGLRVGAGNPLPITIPNSCTMIGFPLFLQGVGFDASGTVRFTNALDAVIGTY